MIIILTILLNIKEDILLNKGFVKDKISRIMRPIKLYYPLDLLRKSRFFKYRFQYPYLKLLYKKGKVQNNKNKFDDHNKFTRLVNSLKIGISYRATGQWEEIYNNNQILAVSLIKKNDYVKLKKILSNPLSNDLMYGFDNLSKSLQSIFRLETFFECSLTADHFLALAEYSGVINYQSPESLVSIFRKSINLKKLINKTILQIFKKDIIFPNIYPGERGIITDFGIASLRTPSAIYQAMQVSKLGQNICEIGPGLGRTAYFSKLLGVKKYTLVDLPISSLTQSYYLINSLPNEKISFTGEPDLNEGIEFRLPDDFFKSNQNYDLVLNVDSITEIDKEIAKDYLKEIIKRSKYFLSINHESNKFTVRSLVSELKSFKLLSIHRSWIRPGYLEELYEIEKNN
tara:strand:+ start:1201 stop:2400 length:1200 start_codon:yes stop_codon:yes gene_type:complete